MGIAIYPIRCDTACVTATLTSLAAITGDSLTVLSEDAYGKPSLIGYVAMGVTMSRFRLNNSEMDHNPFIDDTGSLAASVYGGYRWLRPSTPLVGNSVFDPVAYQASGGNEDENCILYVAVPSAPVTTLKTEVGLNGEITGLPQGGRYRVLRVTVTPAANVWGDATAIGPDVLKVDKNYVILGSQAFSATAGALRFVKIKSGAIPDQFAPSWRGQSTVDQYNWKAGVYPYSVVVPGSQNLIASVYNAANEATTIYIYVYEY